MKYALVNQKQMDILEEIHARILGNIADYNLLSITSLERKGFIIVDSDGDLRLTSLGRELLEYKVQLQQKMGISWLTAVKINKFIKYEAKYGTIQ